VEGLYFGRETEESEVDMKSWKKYKYIHNEKGIALMLVLLISFIALVMVATMLYLITQGTRTSGFLKRYQSAREAGVGGAELTAALIQNRGQLEIPLIVDKLGADCIAFLTRCDCGDPDVIGDNTPATCLCAKLCDPTASWPFAVTCNADIDPTDAPEVQCVLPGESGKSYLFSSKIIDTVAGSSDLSGESLGGTGVVSSNSGLIPSPPAPYLYRVEVESTDAVSVIEKSRWSVLYAF